MEVNMERSQGLVGSMWQSCSPRIDAGKAPGEITDSAAMETRIQEKSGLWNDPQGQCEWS